MNLLFIDQLITNLAVFLSFGCFGLIAIKVPTREQKISFLFSIFCVITCLGYCQIAFSRGNLGMMIFGCKLTYYGVVILGATFLFYISYLRVKLPAVLQYVLVSAMILLIIMTFFMGRPDYSASGVGPLVNFLRTMIYKGLGAGFSYGIPYLIQDSNWGYIFYLVVNLSCVVILFYAFNVTFKKLHGDERRNSILFLAILVIPDLFYLFEKVFKVFFGIDGFPMVPIGIVISDLLYVYLVYFRRFCDVNELANNRFFDYISMPALVVGKNNQMENFNITAANVFPEIQDDNIGKNIEDFMSKKLLYAVNCIIVLAKNNYDDTVVSLSDRDFIEVNDIVYRLKGYKIKEGGRFQGYLIWFDDVTLLRNYSINLERRVYESTKQMQKNLETLNSVRNGMVYGFAALAENHDASTKGHLRRTAYYSQAIAEKVLNSGLYPDLIDEEFVETIAKVAPLHDIGKTYIDKRIFDKPGKLTEEETRLMRTHTTLGGLFLEETLEKSRGTPYAKMAIEIATSHHEWWNGSGYPKGLKGKEIPLSARIMAIADTFDALVTVRPYKKAFSLEEAFSIIEEETGTHFDPTIAKAFFAIKGTIVQIYDEIEE